MYSRGPQSPVKTQISFLPGFNPVQIRGSFTHNNFEQKWVMVMLGSAKITQKCFEWKWIQDCLSIKKKTAVRKT